jgi:Uma2 family endonuclease
LEIVLPGNRSHDRMTRRIEITEAKTPEYWVIDPQTKMISVLDLAIDDSCYTVHGTFERKDGATFVLLQGTGESVKQTFDFPFWCRKLRNEEK